MRKMNAFPVLFASWQLNCNGHESFDCDRDSDGDGDSDGKSALSRCKFCFSFNFNSTFRIRRE